MLLFKTPGSLNPVFKTRAIEDYLTYTSQVTIDNNRYGIPVELCIEDFVAKPVKNL